MELKWEAHRMGESEKRDHDPKQENALKIFRDFRGIIDGGVDNETTVSGINNVVSSINDADLAQRLTGLLNNYDAELKTKLRVPDAILGTAINKEVDKKIDILSGIILKLSAKTNELIGEEVGNIIKGKDTQAS
jgi:hypothetical protein